MELVAMASEKMKRKRGSNINIYYSKRVEEEEEKEKEKEAGNISVFIPCSNIISSSVVPRTVTRTICFWGHRGRDRTVIDWFVLKVSIDLQNQKVINKQVSAFDHTHLHRYHSNEEGKLKISPVFTYRRKSEGGSVPLWGSSFTTLGTFLYSVGGSFYYRTEKYNSLHTSPKQHRNRTNLVHYFDTSSKISDSSGWVQAPSMITPRMRPQVISLNHKLYVFGCCRGSRKCRRSPECLVWAEVFDPSLGLWTALPDPPFSMNLVICSPNHLNQHSSNTILAIADKRKVYELNTLTNCWACKFEFLTPWRGNEYHRPVLVDDILYWFDDDIHAYDISNDKTFTGPVQDISFQRSMRLRPDCYDGYNCIGWSRPAIFHLGGSYFSLLGFAYPTTYNGCHINVTPHCYHCLTIKVSRTKECYKRFGLPGLDTSEFFLRGAVISCQSFLISRGCTYLDGRFLCDA